VANNPVEQAVFEAQHQWVDVPIDLIVSVGCGIPPTTPGSRRSSLQWVSTVIDLATETELIWNRINSWIFSAKWSTKTTRLNPPGISLELSTTSEDELRAAIRATTDYLTDIKQEKELQVILEHVI